MTWNVVNAAVIGLIGSIALIETGEAQRAELSLKDLVGTTSITTTMQRMSLLPKSRFGEAQKVAQKQLQRQKLLELTITKPRTRVVQKPIIRLFEEKPIKEIEKRKPRLGPPPIFELPPVYPSKPSKSFGYQVLIRTKGTKKGKKFSSGEFAPISSGVLSKEQALSLGQAITAGTAKRSFKLTPTFGPMAETKRLPAFRPEMFTRRGRTFIEKTKYAINMPGEYKEITQKGLATKKGGLWGSKRPNRLKPFKVFS